MKGRVKVTLVKEYEPRAGEIKITAEGKVEAPDSIMESLKKDGFYDVRSGSMRVNRDGTMWVSKKIETALEKGGFVENRERKAKN